MVPPPPVPGGPVGRSLSGFHTGFFSRGGGTFVCGKVDQLRPRPQGPRGVWGHAPPEKF